MTRPRVYLCEGDDGWAVNEDRRLTRAALDPIVEWVDAPRDAQVIHACWWEPLMRLDRAAVEGKHVLCHMAGDPARVLTETPFGGALRRVNAWVAQSLGAFEKMKLLAGRVAYVPYAVDEAWFEPPRGPASEAVDRARREIPAGAYVISNFHRDTAGAAFAPGMDVPKLVKGPDLFVEILAALQGRGRNVAALIAGPRRHWVRARLRERGVPCVFAGREIAGEDYPANILPASDMAHLYSMSTLVLCTSRSEGGPRGVLEAAAAGCAQLSTPVGLAPDVLHPDCLIHGLTDAIERVENDLASGAIRRLIPATREVVRARHTLEAARERWAEVYATLVTPAPFDVRGVTRGAGFATDKAHAPIPPLHARSRRVSFWNHFTPPPWGGGNQFMIALEAQARRMGIDCTRNGEGARADGHILNSVQFDGDRFTSMVEPGAARVVHRIDGPISVLRGTPESLEQDRLCFDVNARYATATVIQSWHTVRFLAEMGFRPVRPALIRNACDPRMFWQGTDRPEALPPHQRIRIIATAWSPSPGKGARVYEWLDEHLDPARHELTFVGNTPARLKRARVLPPQPSEALAALLREHDVYLTASRNDPCSNALIEALACGLPALYYDSGGHPEIVGFAGLPFTRPDEIPGLLERLRPRLGAHRRIAALPSMEQVCRSYLDLLFGEGPYRS
jgi:glycosyltransferase involved in cell wall biosynthesis